MTVDLIFCINFFTLKVFLLEDFLSYDWIEQILDQRRAEKGESKFWRKITNYWYLLPIYPKLLKNFWWLFLVDSFKLIKRLKKGCKKCFRKLPPSPSDKVLWEGVGGGLQSLNPLRTTLFSKTKILIFEYFSKFPSEMNSTNPFFTLFWYPTLHMWNFYFSSFVCRCKYTSLLLTVFTCFHENFVSSRCSRTIRYTVN